MTSVRMRAVVVSMGVFFVYLLLAVVGAQPLSTHPTEYLPNNADGVVFAWGLAWVCHQLARDPLHVFDANVFHPHAHALGFGEPLIGEAAVAWPFWMSTGNDVFTFNATLVTTLALNGLCAFWLIRRVVGSSLAAFLAGEMFALTTGNYDSAARIQSVSTQWTPLVLLFLIRLLEQPRWRDALGLGLAFAMQGLACDYYQLFVATLIVIAAPFFLQGHALRAVPWTKLVAAAALAFAVLAPADIMQLRALDTIESSREAPHYARLDEYWKALPTNLIYGSVLAAPERPFDHRHFIGLLPVILGVAGLFAAFGGGAAARETPWARSRSGFLAFGLAAAVLARGPRVPTPWGEASGPFHWLQALVPGYAQIRVATRFLPFVRLSVAVFAGIALATLGQRLRPRWRVVAALVLGLLIPLEHLSVPLPAWRVSSGERAPRVYHWLAGLETRGPVVEFPPHASRRRMAEPFWQHFSTLHWLPLVNGFSSYYPPSRELIYDELLDLPSSRGVSLLRALGVRYLVFHPQAVFTPEQARAVRRFERLAPAFADSLKPLRSFDDDVGPYPDDNGRLGLGRERVFEVLGDAVVPAPRPARLVLQSSARWRCESHPAAGGCEQAFDGDMRTAFSTGATQREGDFLRIVFAAPVRVRMVSLRCGRQGNFYPRSPELLGLVEGEWRPLESRHSVTAFLDTILHNPESATLDIVVAQPIEVGGIEVHLGPASSRFNPWVLPEIEVFS